MTIRQKFLRFVYPAYVRLSRISPNKSMVLLNDTAIPKLSFYALQATLTDGSLLDFGSLRGKKVLLVNTASGCGFTEQFDQLQLLFKEYNGALVVLSFPTNDFGEEKSNDEAIAIFCQENFRVSFPIIKKGFVKPGKDQHMVFTWLTDPDQNGWNSRPPRWNFCKYLVNEHGMLTGYFGAAIEPLGDEIALALQSKK